MLQYLVPPPAADSRDAILEARPRRRASPETEAYAAWKQLRAGVGGEEAALFTTNIFALYEKYAALRGKSPGRCLYFANWRPLYSIVLRVSQAGSFCRSVSAMLTMAGTRRP